MFSLLNKRERKRSALLLLSIFVNSVVEILGLAVLVPVIGLVVQPDAIEKSPYLSEAFHLTSAFGINTPKRFLILLCALLIAAFLFKAIFGLAVNLFQSRFSFAVAHRLSGQMSTHDFSKSLELMRSTNSGNLIAEINTWPIAFAQTFMVGGLMILSESTVVALVSLGLLFYKVVPEDLGRAMFSGRVAFCRLLSKGFPSVGKAIPFCISKAPRDSRVIANEFFMTPWQTSTELALTKSATQKF